jgi:ubiquinone/menaquinone biosynthesis C-methylase UbiE
MNADAIAASYRWIEYAAFGDTLERRRFALLSLTRHSRRILLPGEGDGRFLQRLLAENATGEIDVIESSSRMIALASRRIPESHRHRVRLHHRDFLDGRMPGPSYDLIVTNFFLDCFPADEVRQVVHKCARALEPGGIWLVNEFNEPKGVFRGAHARVWLGAMYRFFRFTTGLEASCLAPYADLLCEAGLRLSRQEQSRLGLVVTQAWARTG